MEGNKIKYSKEFKSFEGTEWIGVDVVVNDGESWDEKWKEAQERVNRWANRNIPTSFTPLPNGTGDYQPPPFTTVSQEIPSIDPYAKDKTEIAIDNANSLDELAKLKIHAEKYYLQQAYMSKMKQFV
jgi:hypothetical protein